MTRDPNKEKEYMLNGNRFTVNTGEQTGVFIRDVDKLFYQYKNLRQSLFMQYKDYLNDPFTQSELMSYIDEQFVRLVKEYDINGPVDFPGYIKTKLNYRVKHSYLKGEYRDRQRIFVLKNDFDVSNLIAQNPANDEELGYYEALEYSLHGISLTSLEKDILFYIMQELTETQIEKKVKKKYSKDRLSSATIREHIDHLKNFLRERLHDSQNF
jgi:hypothetical protein